LKIHREGYPFIALFAAVNLLAFLLSLIVLHGALKSRPAMEAPYRSVDPEAPPSYTPFANASAFLLCALQTSLWLGAWYDPFGIVWHLERISHDTGVGPAVTNPTVAIVANAVGLLIFLCKALLLSAFQNALARNLPRYRLAELFPLLHKVLLPASVFNFLAAVAYLWLCEPLLKLQNITQIALAIVGAVVTLVSIPAMLYARVSAKRTS